MLTKLKTGVAATLLMTGAAFADGHGGPYAEYAGTTLVVNFPAHPHYNAAMKVLPEFTKETGINVVYDVFDSNEVLETKLLAGGTGYDVVVPTGTFLSRQIQAGVFDKLDKSKLSNIGNMWSDIEARVAKYDPDNAYSINYMWGTTGLGYNVEKVKAALGEDAPLDSWDLLFKPENAAKLQECGIHVLDAPTELFPAALNYLGLDPRSEERRVGKECRSRWAPDH